MDNREPRLVGTCGRSQLEAIAAANVGVEHPTPGLVYANTHPSKMPTYFLKGFQRVSLTPEDVYGDDRDVVAGYRVPEDVGVEIWYYGEWVHSRAFFRPLSSGQYQVTYGPNRPRFWFEHHGIEFVEEPGRLVVLDTWDGVLGVESNSLDTAEEISATQAELVRVVQHGALPQGELLKLVYRGYVPCSPFLVAVLIGELRNRYESIALHDTGSDGFVVLESRTLARGTVVQWQ